MTEINRKHALRPDVNWTISICSSQRSLSAADGIELEGSVFVDVGVDTGVNVCVTVGLKVGAAEGDLVGAIEGDLNHVFCRSLRWSVIMTSLVLKLKVFSSECR